MPRLAWYAGVSAALAAGVVVSAFHLRANFYSAMVYLSQSNVCLMILVNLVFLIYGTFIYGLQRVCFGQLRPVEIEQLYEKGWFAVTETCLAMTIFRDELGGFFLVMFTALVTGKVWGWIFDGRVEVLEQQPPQNPGLFHFRLIISLFLSLFYDCCLLNYAVKTVIQQAKPTMMVMFLFEFAILLVCTLQTSMRYTVALWEINITKRQLFLALEARRKEVREQRVEMIRRREAGETTEAEDEPLPDEADVTEDDIEVPGWEAKGQYVLMLDICADLLKLCIYVAFFFVLLGFYGLPIHIMRDLFITSRSFLKRLHSLMRYRQAMRDLDKYADATDEDLVRENTCIICREEMRPWVPNGGQLERTRPKRLPCGHILHAGCLRSWMERQAVCPTCRRSVMLGDRPPAAEANRRDAAVLRVDLNMGAGNNQNPPPAPGADGAGVPGAQGFQNNAQQAAGAGDNLRMINLGPLRIGFAQIGAGEVQNMVNGMANPAGQVDGPAAAVAPAPQHPTAPAPGATPTAAIADQLREVETRIQREFTALNVSQQEATTLRLLLLELQRLRDNTNLANGAAPAEPQPPFPPMMGLPPPPPLYPPQFTHFQPNLSPFMPPRIHSPSVVRLGADPNAVPILSGSADLPEGVAIPPGWSLLPLQRLEGNAPAGAASVPPPRTPPAPASAPSQASAPAAQPPPADQPQSQSSAAQEGAAGSSSSASAPSSQDRPVVPIEQPQPVAPNWGGAAQFFRNNRTPASQAAASEDEAPPPLVPVPTETATANGSAGEGSSAGSKAAAGEPSQQADEEISNGSASKGKARAATVEEAREDDAE